MARTPKSPRQRKVSLWLAVKARVEEILGKLSYSSTFLEAATQSAAEKSIKHAYWALAQYDFRVQAQIGSQG